MSLLDILLEKPLELHILGVGRLNKLQADKAAELAVLISDQYQHRGLGTELVRRLIQIARDETKSPAARSNSSNEGGRTGDKRNSFTDQGSLAPICESLYSATSTISRS